jgi:hypothetical protein
LAEINFAAYERDPRIANLLSAGRAAAKSGDVAQAHGLYQQAAALDPHDEAVWWALLDIVTAEEDRSVCLENILAINPNNFEARRLVRLASLPQQAPVPAPVQDIAVAPAPPVRPTRAAKRKARAAVYEEDEQASEVSRAPNRVLRFIVLCVFFSLLAALLAIVLSILMYGF